MRQVLSFYNEERHQQNFEACEVHTTRKQNWYADDAKRLGEPSSPITEVNLTAANKFFLRDAHTTTIASSSAIRDSPSTSTSVSRGAEEGPTAREDHEEIPKRRHRLLQPLVHEASSQFDLGPLLANRPPGQDFFVTSLRLASALAHLLRRDELLETKACEIMTTCPTRAMLLDQEQACNNLELRRESGRLSGDNFELLLVEPLLDLCRTELAGSRIQSQSETTHGHADALVVASKPAKQWTHNTPPHGCKGTPTSRRQCWPASRGISKKLRDPSHRRTSSPSPDRGNVLEWSPRARDRPSFHASPHEKAYPRKPEPEPDQARPQC